jgi:hypothetical protein
MNYHTDLPTRVRQASADELAQLLRLYPHNARVVDAVRFELARRPDSPKRRALFIPLPRA